MGSVEAIKVRSVDGLYDTAKDLLSKNVRGTNPDSFDAIITSVDKAIIHLQNKWKGPDAGVNIGDLVKVRNGLVNYRNVMGELAVTAGDISIDFRNTQIANLANKPAFSKLVNEEKNMMPEYSDNTDQENLEPDARADQQLVKAAVNNCEALITSLRSRNTQLFDNWQKGGNRQKYYDAFNDFTQKFNGEYKPKLEHISSNLDQALKNWGF